MKRKRPEPIADRSWQRRWLAVLATANMPSEPSQLRQQIQGCRVRALEIASGEISADVVHPTLGACDVVIRIPTLANDSWQSLIEALANDANLSTQLLAGEMPAAIQRLAAPMGISLAPTVIDEIEIQCACCTSAKPFCPPVLAAYVAVGEMLDEDPWLLARLRGRERQVLINALNEARARGAAEKAAPAAQPVRAANASADSQAEGAEEGPQLVEALDHYWGQTRQQLAYQHHIAAPHIELVLLRRLGSPPFADTNLDVYETFADIYRYVTEASLALAYSPEEREIEEGD